MDSTYTLSFRVLSGECANFSKTFFETLKKEFNSFIEGYQYLFGNDVYKPVELFLYTSRDIF